MATASDTNANWAQRFWLIAAAITVARIVLLFVSEAELGPDEAQYWYWSQHPAFGYFSKPPLIAWAIGGFNGGVRRRRMGGSSAGAVFPFRRSGVYIFARRASFLANASVSGLD